MDGKPGQITFTETEDGFRVEVTGRQLKDMLRCCTPVLSDGGVANVCCAAGAETRSDCCPPADEQK
jgi:hypothetical protein